MSTVGGPRLSTISKFTNTYSLDFDGMDDYIDCGNSAALKPNIITVSCWVKGSTQTAYTRIISQDGPTGGADAYGFYVTPTLNKVVFAIKTDVTGTVTSATSGVVLDNSWHHLVGTYDGSEVILYVDGVAVGSPSAGTSILSYGSGTLTIGCFSEPTSLPSYLFNGNIDEVSIFNSVIPIGDLWDGSGQPTDLSLLATPPIAWYRMGDNGSYKSPQFLIPNNENKDKVSNYSFDFDGVDDKVSLTSLIPLGLTSISFWMKSTHSSGNDSITSGLGNLGFIGTTPLVALAFANYRYFANQSSKFDGQWHHWFLLIAGSGQSDITNSRLFVDGVEISSGTTISSGTPSSWTNSEIGRGNYGYLNCSINNFAVWEGSDESANVSTIYNSGTPNDISSLSPTVWLKMGEEANFTSNWLVDNSALTNYSKRSFEFDGIDDYVDCGASTLSGETALSISAWVYPTAYGGAAADSFVSTDSVLPRGFYLSLYNAQNFRFAFTTNGSNLTAINTAYGTVDLNVWQHILVTWDQVNLKFYKNGDLLNTVPTTFASNGTFTTTNNLLIGVRQLGNVGPFEGKIDEVAIFNEVVDVADVWDGSGEPIDVSAVSGIVNNYRMGEDASFDGTNWTVPDNVGSNDGTSNAMTVDALVGEAPNYSGGGISQGMDIEDRVGNAPNSDNNTLSINMEREDRVEDTP